MELRVRHTYSGFLPPVGLHCRGGVFYQESSYSFFWFFGVMFAAATVLAVLPWDVPANPGGKLKYWLAGFCVWGGICGLAGFFVRNAFLQTIIINPQNQPDTVHQTENQTENHETDDSLDRRHWTSGWPAKRPGRSERRWLPIESGLEGLQRRCASALPLWACDQAVCGGAGGTL